MSHSYRHWTPAPRRHRLLMALFMACALVSPGCSDSGRMEFNPKWTLDEHGNPDFKPDEFRDALDTLKERFGLITTMSEPQRTEAIQEFRQIVRWLPEFAADTQIKRSGWEELTRQSRSIEAASQQADYFAVGRQAAFFGELSAISDLVPPDTLYSVKSAGEPDKQSQE